MPIPLPGQTEQTPPQPVKFEDFGTLNTKANRTAIAPNEAAWIENWMPIGPGNMRTLYAESAPIYECPGGLEIIYFQAFNFGDARYMAVFHDDGTAVQVDLSDGTTVAISATPGTFYPGENPGLPQAAQWKSQYLLICAPFTDDGYWVWDGTSLFGAGTLSPEVLITNSGSTYTSAPTVTAYGGTGTGATFSATVEAGSVVEIEVTDPGSGYLGGEKVTVVITGGGSDDQARATATISNTLGVGIVTVLDGGAGYTADVSVTFSGGGGTGARAVVTGAANGVITEVTVIDAGSGYTSAPTVAFAASSGGGASAIADMRAGMITAITVNSGGSGYVGSPSVIISAPDLANFPTIQAEAYATVAAGVVSAITVTNRGLGYSKASVDLEGGNDAANAIVSLMPHQIAGNTIETYQGYVWLSDFTKTSHTAPDSVSDFAASSGGGSFPATDSFLRRKISRLFQANGFLYLIADSSINVISNTQTSGVPPTTTFNNANVDPQVGTPWRDSVAAFGRAIVFANSTGVYALYGGAAEKVSDPLDGLFSSASFNTNQQGLEPTACVVTLFGIRCYCLLFTTTDPYVGTLRDIIAIWNGQKWFIATQLDTPDFLGSQEIDSVLSAWGCNNTSLYQLFTTPSSELTKVWQTKLMSPQGYWVTYQVNQIHYVAQSNVSDPVTIDIAIDTERGTATPQTCSVSGTLQFVGTGPIQFTGLLGADIVWTAKALVVGGYGTENAINYGAFIGATVTTDASDLTFISLGVVMNEYAPRT